MQWFGKVTQWFGYINGWFGNPKKINIYSLTNSIQSDLNTYLVNDRTMYYYAHDTVDSGTKYMVSILCEDLCLQQQLLFNKLETFEVDCIYY